jgi:hypothetical protein
MVTVRHGIKHVKSFSMVLGGSLNTDWAGCPNDRRSTGDFVVFLGPNLISWSSRK